MNIPDNLMHLITTHLGKKPEDILPEKRLEEDLGADSLDKIELLLAIETEFGLADIDEADHDRITTVEDLVKFTEYAEKAA